MSEDAEDFHRRPLPDTCIDFSSELGIKLFTEALLQGTAKIYFKLASQFRTQDDPAFCGLGTLVMVLNALEVDPGKIWKAPWRFYHESMLDCCVPLETVRETGITIQQFSCLAKCNGLTATVSYGEDSKDFLEKFRKMLLDSVRSENQILVASYDRSVLEQTGAGHFSPLAAYHAESDRVLIMDVARFKYPPHWVEIEHLKKALAPLDPTTGQPRGLVELELKKERNSMRCAKREENEMDFKTSATAFKKFLLKDPLKNEDDEFELCCLEFETCFASYLLNGIIDAIQLNSCLECAEKQKKAIGLVCADIQNTNFDGVFSSPEVVALFVVWPFEFGSSKRENELGNVVNDYRRRFLDKFTRHLRNLLRGSELAIEELRPFSPSLSK